jgi:hypothetical protein
MDLFSNYTTEAFIPSERKEDLLHGLIQVTTPICRGELLLKRTNRAPALETLAKSPPHEIKSVNIQLVLPDAHFNKNSNAKIDKIIQELQLEIRKICPEQRVLSVSELVRATCNLNNRIRKSGLTASGIQSRILWTGPDHSPSKLFPLQNLVTWPLSPAQPTNMLPQPPTWSPNLGPPPPLCANSSTLGRTLHLQSSYHHDLSPQKNSDMIRLKPLIPAYSPHKNPSKNRGPPSEPPLEALRDTANRPPENQ